MISLNYKNYASTGSALRKTYKFDNVNTAPKLVSQIVSPVSQRIKTKIKIDFFLKLATVFVLSISICLGYVKIFNQHYKINGMKTSLEALTTEKQHIELEISNLNNLDRIGKLASSNLHMQKLTQNQIINLDS